MENQSETAGFWVPADVHIPGPVLKGHSTSGCNSPEARAHSALVLCYPILSGKPAWNGAHNLLLATAKASSGFYLCRSCHWTPLPEHISSLDPWLSDLQSLPPQPHIPFPLSSSPFIDTPDHPLSARASFLFFVIQSSNDCNMSGPGPQPALLYHCFPKCIEKQRGGPHLPGGLHEGGKGLSFRLVPLEPAH